ncbi:MAG TPA: DinB family protein [Vicinamibacterales bacterium]|nr:DinB family protein [Vicinamibacterales bacterium]
MSPDRQPEVWMRGAVPGYPALLQPVVHSLLQSLEEVQAHIPALTPDQLRARPGGAASIGYHVRHAAGSVDRLLTYARGEQLSPEQMTALRAEGAPDAAEGAAARLVEHFRLTIERALAQVRDTPEASLLDARGVGRAQLPSTVLGLLFHAAEHTQRHMGQMVTTIKIIAAGG